MSETDIEPGANWFNTIGKALESADGMGVFVLTEENLSSRWLHFEAGWIASRGFEARVCCLLLGVQPEQVEYPLRAFQSLPATEASAAKLLGFLNDGLEEKLRAEQLAHSVDGFQPGFARAIQEALLVPVRAASAPVDLPTQVARLAEAVHRIEGAVAAQGSAMLSAMREIASLNRTTSNLGFGGFDPVSLATQGLFTSKGTTGDSVGTREHIAVRKGLLSPIELSAIAGPDREELARLLRVVYGEQTAAQVARELSDAASKRESGS